MTRFTHCLIWEDRQILLREGLTIVGRAEDTDVRIPLPSVSRQHARIAVCDREVTIEDLGSRHGTWRNTTRVGDVVPLVSGDVVRLGGAVMAYRLVLPSDTTKD